MYGIFTNICPCPKSSSYVGKYTIHGAYGLTINIMDYLMDYDPHMDWMEDTM